MEKLINRPPKIKRNQHKNCILELLEEPPLPRRPSVEERARLEKEKGFELITLDSGHHRHTAHRLYLNKGFEIKSHHFVKKL